MMSESPVERNIFPNIDASGKTFAAKHSDVGVMCGEFLGNRNSGASPG